ncbi:sensor histidine kinase [Microbacterium sp.]|uniref:sensor histidine kinase n=1 Tax=Microbacterium sp. TaxID=51671 RepID=UPI0039E30177
MATERVAGRETLRARFSMPSRVQGWPLSLGVLLFSLAVFAGLWLTVLVSAGWRWPQLMLGAMAVLGAVLSRWVPFTGALLAGVATAVAGGFGVTADPFLLAGVGVFSVAERRGSRRFPWWLFAACALLALAALVLGNPPGAQEFEVRMRGVLLSAVVLVAAWVLGVRTRQVRQEAAARARTEERLRLARDVHDVLSHSLGVIGVRAGVAAHVTALGEVELRETLREVESQARSSLAELKGLLQRERADETETTTASLPLTGLLRDVANTAERSGLRVELDCSESLDRLPVIVRTTVYRVVQEAVTNSIRHAAASTLHICAVWADATVEVTVRDDGIGARDGVREGHGLTGMRERVALAGGHLRIDLTSEGFAVTARLPLSDENAGQAGA